MPTGLCNDPCAFLKAKNGYNHAFCSCYRAPLTCIATIFCPCIVVGWLAGKMDNRPFSCIPCVCPHVGVYRNRRVVQAQMGASEGESEDSSMCAAGLCGYCA